MQDQQQRRWDVEPRALARSIVKQLDGANPPTVHRLTMTTVKEAVTSHKLHVKWAPAHVAVVTRITACVVSSAYALIVCDRVEIRTDVSGKTIARAWRGHAPPAPDDPHSKVTVHYIPPGDSFGKRVE